MSGGGVMLRWDFPTSYNFDIRGFTLFRSDKPDTNFVEYARVPRENREYLDKQPLMEGYYKLGVSDWLGHFHESLGLFVQQEDLEAPAAPIWKKSLVLPDGRVELSWE